MAGREARIRLLSFIALMSTAVALGGGLAHAFELPNKIILSRDDYFMVQQIYRGWNLLAFVLLVEVGSMIMLAVALGRGAARRWTLVALGCVAGAQILFWIFTFPANTATENWTTIPADWESLRARWEYSHLGGALFQLLALASLVATVLRRHAHE